jgi:hypothetical protein
MKKRVNENKNFVFSPKYVNWTSISSKEDSFKKEIR